MLENWLIADPDALGKHAGRYQVSQAMRRKVAPNKADRTDATALIKRAVKAPGQYEKVADAEKILSSFNVLTAASNSRSLRHFLHVLGDAVYAVDCKTP